MRYQEAYVTTKNQKYFENLIKYVRDIGYEYFENILSMPAEVITLNNSISGTYKFMCQSDKIYNFNSGDKFIYFIGEREPLINEEILLTQKIIDEKIEVDIIFTECFPSDEIFEAEGFAEHEIFLF